DTLESLSLDWPYSQQLLSLSGLGELSKLRELDLYTCHIHDGLPLMPHLESLTLGWIRFEEKLPPGTHRDGKEVKMMTWPFFPRLKYLRLENFLEETMAHSLPIILSLHHQQLQQIEIVRHSQASINSEINLIRILLSVILV